MAIKAGIINFIADFCKNIDTHQFLSFFFILLYVGGK
jgi:hypothetical protein